jgi:hypothetical protein
VRGDVYRAVVVASVEKGNEFAAVEEKTYLPKTAVGGKCLKVPVKCLKPDRPIIAY